MSTILKLLDLFPGYKTYIAAALAAIVALNGMFHWVDADTQASILAAAAALGLYGVRQAISREGK